MGLNLRYSPLEWDEATKSFDFGGATITDATIAALLSTTGNVWYVDSVNGLDLEGDQGKTKDKPLKSWDYAYGRCTANNGDVIALMPGYTDTVAGASGITCDVEGVTTIGLGHGADRPNITFSATASSIDVTAASTRIFNIIGTAGIDGITEAFNVQAADCEFVIEWQDGSATVECITVFLCNASADRLFINLKYRGFTGGDACDSPVSLNGSVGAHIIVDFYGKAATAIVEFITAAVEDVFVEGYFYCSGTTDLSKNVVDTATGSTWFVQGFDGAAGSLFSGGSGDAVAAGDLSSISSAIDVIDAYHDVATADAATNAVMSDVIGNKTDAAVNAATTTKTLMAYLKGVLNELAVPAQNNTDNGFVNDVVGQKTDAAASGAVTTTDTLVGYVKQLVTELAVVDSEVGVIDGYFDVPTADATTDATIRDVVGRKTDAAVQAVATTKSLMAYLKGVQDMLAGTTGIASFPSAAAPANNVSLAEVLRDAWDVLRNGTGGTEPATNKSVIDAIGFDGSAFVAGGLGKYLPQCVEKTDGAVLNGLDSLFTISGGLVRCKIVGIVTTLIGGAANLRLQHTTTDPAATVDLNAGAVAVDNDAVGTIYHNLGATGVFTPSTGLGFVILDPVTVEETEYILAPGTLKCLGSAAQDGVIAWYMTWQPLTPGASVVAAA